MERKEVRTEGRRDKRSKEREQGAEKDRKRDVDGENGRKLEMGKEWEERRE